MIAAKSRYEWVKLNILTDCLIYNLGLMFAERFNKLIPRSFSPILNILQSTNKDTNWDI